MLELIVRSPNSVLSVRLRAEITDNQLSQIKVLLEQDLAYNEFLDRILAGEAQFGPRTGIDQFQAEDR